MSKKKIRLDKFLIENNIADEKLILPMVMAGEIYVNGQKAMSIAQQINIDSKIEIKNIIKKYVSRGGFKLEAALRDFNFDVKDKICADFGASTGGFSDVLLQNGAKKVYAIETGKNLLDIKLQKDTRVVRCEGVSLFNLNKIEDKIDLAVADLSFIPLSHALLKISEITNNAEIIALLKPHYEAHDESLLRHGIVKDDETREIIVNNFKNWLYENNYILKGIIMSPIKGGGGNIEYLVYISKIIL